jgi:histone arginine demethylase JMJD6
MKYYAHYARTDAQREDSPLYIFDEDFGGEETKLEKDYQIPKYFQEDLFALVGKRRPPHKWIVIGPARSGTGIHVDPLGTSAWNALVHGHKRWVLFPPYADPVQIKPRGARGYGSGEGIAWFHEVLPRFSDKEARDMGMMDFVQHPGECVFVPGGKLLHMYMLID